MRHRNRVQGYDRKSRNDTQRRARNVRGFALCVGLAVSLAMSVGPEPAYGWGSSRLGLACVTAPDCEDINPCTADLCVSGACAYRRDPGFAGVDCELYLLENEDICGAELLRPRLRKVLLRKVERARTLGEKLARTTKPRKVSKLRARATRQLVTLARKVDRFTRKNKMSAECKTTIDQSIGTIDALFAELGHAG
jgi:hypothetical protein